MSWPRRVLRPLLSPFAAFAAAGAPWLLLALRIWTAQAFLTHQIAMLMSGGALNATLSGAWWAALVEHIAGSGWGAVFEALCPLLLGVGFLARPAALAMLLQTALLRMPGQAGTGVFWTLLLCAVLFLGPGRFSVDRALRPSAKSAALPGAAAIARAYADITRWAGPVYLVALRIALAATLIGLQQRMSVGMTLPAAPPMFAELPAPVAAACAVALLAGLLTRPFALALIVLTPFDAASSQIGERLYWLLLLGVVFTKGGGWLSLDRVVADWLRTEPPAADLSGLPHVVIVGGGFGGIAAAEGLRTAPCRVTLIDQRNYHLFQPLLYQVATAGLSPADIATPIREMLRTQANLRVLLGEVTGVDTARQEVQLGTGRIGYDTLVIATGARHSYFGHEEWSGLAPGLKTIDDATAIRRRILLAFEAAEAADDPAASAAWLTFVVVGGGPTGVELAGAITELARFGMEGEFRRIDPAGARVVLVQAAPLLLPSFPAPLSAEAARALKALGVELMLDTRVEAIDEAGVVVSGTPLAARTVLWAAGVMASPAAAWLDVAPDRSGRVPVGPDLRVAGHGEVFVVGDTAASKAWNGAFVPGLAPAAKQGGAYVARVIRRRLRGSKPPAPFRYRHLGSLATIGRRAAVADFGAIRVKGALAWWLWGAVHIAFLVGGRNRTVVVLEWLWDYLTFRRGTRLITGG